MSKKIYLSPSNQNANKFAVGNTNEGTVWNEIAKKLQTKLSVYDCEVKIPDASKRLEARATEAKSWGADIYVAMHSNALNGKVRGVEVYYDPKKTDSTKRKALAQAVSNELGKLFTNRGLKTSSTLIDCYLPSMPSIIGECGFHDNLADAQMILDNKDKIAELYCNAIVSYLGLSKKTTTTTTTTSTTTKTEEFKYYYVVKKGDYLSKIASKFSTTVDKLVKANNIKNANIITVGQKIGIPDAFVYSVKSGDTLSKIAKTYGTTTAKLVKANGILNANIIRVAQQLVIVK